MRHLLCLLLTPALLLAGDSWTQFRGPGGTGVSDAVGLPTSWDEKTNVAWKTPIHDKGWSSPVISGKHIWLTTATADGKKSYAVCVHADTGKVVHDLLLFETPKPPYFFLKDANSHASPTPVIDGGRVYAHFGSTGTACLDAATGKTIWSRRDLVCDHWRGPGSSPVVWNDLLFLTFDGHDKQYVAALDKATGKTVWTTPRDIDYRTTNGDAKKGFSTPVVIDVNKKPQLISPAAMATVALDPATGKELWKVYTGGMNAATVPQYGHGLLYLTSGDAPSKLLAVKPTGSGDVTKTHVAWTQTRDVPSRPTPLLHGDLLFTLSNGGIVRCMDAKSGNVVWSRRITGNFYASPVLADGNLYAFNQSGTGFVVGADREGKVRSANALDAGCNACPAIVGKALFVRTLTHLYRIEGRAETMK